MVGVFPVVEAVFLLLLGLGQHNAASGDLATRLQFCLNKHAPVQGIIGIFVFFKHMNNA